MRRQRAAFTLIEALVTISITALAASVLLVGSTTSLETAQDAQDQAAAQGMAQQLMDEAVGNPYIEYGGNPYSSTIGPSISDRAGSTRRLFDDIGDFNGWRSQPPTDSWGIELGKDDGAGGTRNSNFQVPAGKFNRWRQEISVYYVSESDVTTPLGGTTSDYRAVEVRIVRDNPQGGSRELAKLRRVVAYVPPLP